MAMSRDDETPRILTERLELVLLGRRFLASIVSGSPGSAPSFRDPHGFIAGGEDDRTTVYDFAGRGVIPLQRLGKRLLFRRGALVAWLDSSLCKVTSARKAG
jgi:hypothetical protein